MVKIVLVGPAYPHRGGISHHMNQLISSLIEKNIQVELFTFFTKCSRVLFRRKTHLEPEGTINSLPNQSPLFAAHYSLDSLSILSWYRTAKHIIRVRPDYCLIRYWHSYLSPCFSFISWLLRCNKIPVIVIIDNILPHERHFADFFLTRLFFNFIDGAITQSMVVENQFNLIFPHIHHIIIPHPTYSHFGPRVLMREARKKINIANDKKLLLFFGFIRPYKGLDLLIKIMPIIISHFPNIHLLIAGECFGGFDSYHKLIYDLKLEKYITLNLNYIPNFEIPYYFGASDLLVMPYRSITNSGIENIAKFYANQYLVTVGIEGYELADKIILKLKETPQSSQNIINDSWDFYTSRLIYFLQSNGRTQ